MSDNVLAAIFASISIVPAIIRSYKRVRSGQSCSIIGRKGYNRAKRVSGPCGRGGRPEKTREKAEEQVRELSVGVSTVTVVKRTLPFSCPRPFSFPFPREKGKTWREKGKKGAREEATRRFFSPTRATLRCTRWRRVLVADSRFFPSFSHRLCSNCGINLIVDAQCGQAAVSWGELNNLTSMTRSNASDRSCKV